MDKLIRIFKDIEKKRLKEALFRILGLVVIAIGYFFSSAGRDLPFARWGQIISIIVAAILVLLIFIVIRRATPTVDPTKLAKAVKGLFAFSENDDGELFNKLGRSADIDKLVQHALEDQFPVVVLRGESGSGKTSVLRAGVMYQLKDKARVVYWQATPGAKIEQLESSVRSAFNIGSGKSWLEPPDEKSYVIIIDQFDFLRPDQSAHEPFFSMLRDLCSRSSPYRLKVFVAFREEYSLPWISVQEMLNQTIPQYILQPLSQRSAQEIVGTLLDRARVRIDKESLENYIFGVSKNHAVLPVAIGLGVSVFAELAKTNGRVDFKDYLRTGGAAGLIAHHVQEQFALIPKADREPVLKALSICMIDSVQEKRKMEGATPDALAQTAGIDVERLRVYLSNLSGPGARILERVETQPTSERYRLAHHCLVDVAQRLNEHIPEEWFKLKWSFTEQLEYWKYNKGYRCLLGSEQLRGVLRFRTYLINAKSPARATEFLWKSILLAALRWLGIICVMLLVIAVVDFGVTKMSDWQKRMLLAEGDLPSDLFTNQAAIDSLHIRSSTLHNLRWLRSNRLSDFEVNSTAFESLDGIEGAPNLTSLVLNVANSPVHDLKKLRQLRNLKSLSLFLGGSNIQNVADISSLDQLENISLSLGASPIDFSDLSRLAKLRTLKLDLQRAPRDNLSALSKLTSIRELELILDDSSATELPDVTPLNGLIHLTLSLKKSNIQNLSSIMALRSLRELTLDLEEAHEIHELPDFRALPELRCLSLNITDSGIAQLPLGMENLTKLQVLRLNLTRTHVQALPDFTKLPNLESLELSLEESGVIGLPKLDLLQGKTQAHRGLEHIHLDYKSFRPSDLTKLTELAFVHELTVDIRSLQNSELPQLSGIRDLTNLTLHLNWEQIPTLSNLPQVAQLTLYVGGAIPPSMTQEQATAFLGQIIHQPKLTNLTLYLEDSKLAKLPSFGERSRLEVLSLHLRRSEIQELGEFSELQRLTELSLDLESCHHIYKLPDVSALGNLETLLINIRRSTVQNVNDLANLQQIHKLTLDLSESQITTLPDLTDSNRMNDFVANVQDAPITDFGEVRRRLTAVRKITIGKNFKNLGELPPHVMTLNVGKPPVDDSADRCIPGTSSVEILKTGSK